MHCHAEKRKDLASVRVAVWVTAVAWNTTMEELVLHIADEDKKKEVRQT